MDGILKPDAHEQWRFLAFLCAFAAMICAIPPKPLQELVTTVLTLDTGWQQPMAEIYRALTMSLCSISLLYHLSYENSVAAVAPGMGALTTALIPCSHRNYTTHRILCLAVMTPIHYATSQQRQAGELPGATWPGLFLTPLTGVVLHDTVPSQLAEALFVNALMFSDTAYDSNVNRTASMACTLIGCTAMMLKVTILSAYYRVHDQHKHDGSSSCGLANGSVLTQRDDVFSATSNT